MITFLIAVYRSWPIRPHCSVPHHTIFCTLARPFIGSECDYPAPPKE